MLVKREALDEAEAVDLMDLAEVVGATEVDGADVDAETLTLVIVAEIAVDVADLADVIGILVVALKTSTLSIFQELKSQRHTCSWPEGKSGLPRDRMWMEWFYNDRVSYDSETGIKKVLTAQEWTPWK